MNEYFNLMREKNQSSWYNFKIYEWPTRCTQIHTWINSLQIEWTLRCYGIQWRHKYVYQSCFTCCLQYWTHIFTAVIYILQYKSARRWWNSPTSFTEVNTNETGVNMKNEHLWFHVPYKLYVYMSFQMSSCQIVQLCQRITNNQNILWKFQNCINAPKRHHWYIRDFFRWSYVSSQRKFCLIKSVGNMPSKICMCRQKCACGENHNHTDDA